MTGRFPASGQVAIAGFAHSDIRRHFDRSLGATTVDIARAAIADAGLTPSAIDGFVTSSLFPTAGTHTVQDGSSTVTANWLADRIGTDPRYIASFQGIGQIPGAVALAVNAIASGSANYVVLHRALHNPAGGYHANSMAAAAGPKQWTAPQGYGGPLPMIALPYNEYLQRYKADPEAMAAVAVEARKNGARIPWSYWADRPLTAQEYLAAPMVSDPVRRLDCDIPVDGVAAFVLTSAERARDLPHRPVYIAGHASSGPNPLRLQSHWPLDDIMEGGDATARRLWASAGVGPGDVDLPQLYDGFSPFIYFWLEVLGFCPVGEAHRFVRDGGIDSDDPAGLPVLSGGGTLGNGRMHGIPQMLECYLQLAGRAGARQRAATVGLACHSSPHFGGAVAYTNEPL
ncbi:thiolase family protein [Nocardia jiangxiensis]|uniref:thiolase family protein n=1 Tax=Nocardia jiangxiensis TaxID=282685 RepID=UPI000319F0E6|nr:thiolase family protein [Nocardia jiangxiensis]